MLNSNILPFAKPARAMPGNGTVAARGEVVSFPAAIPAKAATSQLDSGALWSAISEGRIVIHYQPQYELHSNRTLAAEALVRLQARNSELIYPGRFIELAEDSGLIIPLGRLVIEQVCSDLALLRAGGSDLQRVAINVSAQQLNADGELADFIDRMLARYQLDHDDLEFELVERQQLDPASKGQQTLHLLAERGSRIIIDDFGTGYSSISYLTDLPVSGFKLDRALINQLDDPKSLTVVTGLLALARHLQMDVVAEGIETEAQRATLLKTDCRHGQGFGHSRPMPMSQLLDFLGTRRPVPLRLLDGGLEPNASL